MLSHKTQITSSYEMLLRRAPSPAEVTYWMQFFEAGGHEQELRRDLTTSHEFDFELNVLFMEKRQRRAMPEELAELREKALHASRIEELLA